MDFHTPLPNHFGNLLKTDSPCKPLRVLKGAPYFQAYDLYFLTSTFLFFGGKLTDLIGKSAPPIFLKWISHLPIRSWTISRNDLNGAIADFHTLLPNHFGNSLNSESPCKSLRFFIGRPTLPSR